MTVSMTRVIQTHKKAARLMPNQVKLNPYDISSNSGEQSHWIIYDSFSYDPEENASSCSFDGMAILYICLFTMTVGLTTTITGIAWQQKINK